jgi:hypothetical protein
MVKKIARIKDNVVVNVEIWPDDVILVPSMIDVTDKPVGPGYTYDGRNFSPPAPEPTSTEEAEIKTILEKQNPQISQEDVKKIVRYLVSRELS